MFGGVTSCRVAPVEAARAEEWGVFYTNYTLRGVSQLEAARALAGREALVSREENGCVVVFDKSSDDQDQVRVANFASSLSKSLNCAVLTVLNHDDDVLWYQLHEAGKLREEYDSTPNYWGTKGPDALPPSGGNAARPCAAFQAGDTAVVEAILRRSSIAKNDYVFAMDRHKDLVAALSLPEFAVGGAYGGIVRGYFPQGLSKQDLISHA